MIKFYLGVAVILLGIGSAEGASQSFLWSYTQQQGKIATQFRVHRQLNCSGGSFYSTVAALRSSGSFTQRYTYSNFERNRTYCVWVVAVAASGELSKPSNTVQFRVW